MCEIRRGLDNRNDMPAAATVASSAGLATIVRVTAFPSLKARALFRVLTSEPLGYRVVRQSGSHRRMEASGRPPLTFSFHDRQTIRPATVKKILCKQVGLSENEALRLL